MTTARYDRIHESLRVLRETIPAAMDRLACGSRVDLDAWTRALDARVLPRLAPDAPVLAAICGGGSAGKSSLFNALLGGDYSPAGGKAGINRRVLAAAHPDLIAQEDTLALLFEPFGDRPERMRDKADLTEPGCPLYLEDEGVPASVVLLDTPDFDTGLSGEYVNRPMARPVLEACDVLIYIFTNSTYNNLDSTQFMREVLTGVGTRKCFLVYRCHSAFSDEMVRDHAKTAADNLYGDGAEEHVMGIFRADESNDVAAGTQRMQVRPLRPDVPGILDALEQLDPRETREKVNESIVRDALLRADGFCAEAQSSLAGLELYRDMIRLVESRRVNDALQVFPLRAMSQRLDEIWRDTSPAHIKAVRKVSRAVSYPGRKALQAAKWMGGRRREDASKVAGGQDIENIREAALSAAGELRRQLLAHELTGETAERDRDGVRMLERVEEIRAARGNEGNSLPRVETAAGRMAFYVEAHPALERARAIVQSGSWEHGVESVNRLAEEIARPPKEFDADLEALVLEFRENMGLRQRMHESLFAGLEMVPATLAMTYVLATGDPVVGSGIAAKLTSVFGAKDLFAVAVFPASAAWESMLTKTQLKPVIREWHDFMKGRVTECFREEIAGGMLDEADTIVEEVKDRLAKAAERIAECRQAGVE